MYLADESARDMCTGLPGEGEGDRSTGRQECAGLSSLGGAASTNKLPECSFHGHDGDLKEVTVLLSDDDSDEDVCEVPLMARLGMCPEQQQEASYFPNPKLAPQSNTDLSNSLQEESHERVVCLDVSNSCSSEEESQPAECVKGTSDGETTSSVVPLGQSSKLINPSTVGVPGENSSFIGPSTVGECSGSSNPTVPSTASAFSCVTGGSLSSSRPVDPLLTETCDVPLQETPLFTLQPGRHMI